MNHIKPTYEAMPDDEFYASNLPIEYQQSIDEGLDIEAYKELFDAVSHLPKNETKKRLGDVLFDIVSSAALRADYPYNEPSTLDEIRGLRRRTVTVKAPDEARLEDRITGAWMGRICGCMLGKTVEGMQSADLQFVLSHSGNDPMHRYILRSDLSEEIMARYGGFLSYRPYADEIDGMPVDDDTNYVVMAQEIVNRFGRHFTPRNVADTWLTCQGKNAYFTAERVAFRNFIMGYAPPESAMYQNPCREWIGAQIRGDYFGYINPGDPETAAEMAFRDASISHVKNGIYGEMLMAAMLAVAATTDDIKEIILGGLGEIPHTSRLYEDVAAVMSAYEDGMPQENCFRMIHEKYNEASPHGWCHTISNAMIVTAALLYGEGDFGRSICMAVETGFDTDCNGATVGSILGMARGIGAISEQWTKPINNTLHTSIFGIGTVKITERVQLTLEHIKN